MKQGILLLFITAISFTIEVKAKNFIKEHDILFSESQTFPMSQRVCKSGECTPGGLKRNQIVMTFDDGPNSNTNGVLDVLRQYSVPATFFVHIGQRSFGTRAKRIMDRIYNDGHKIANHGRAHSPLHRSTAMSTVASYLLDTHSVIEQYQKPGDLLIYRNPGGFWSSGRARSLNNHSLLRHYIGPIFWNVGGDNVYRNGQLTDAADWRCQQNRMNASVCANGYFRKIMSNYRNNSGSLVLMHDIHSITPRILSELLIKLSETGVSWDFIFAQDIPAVKRMQTDI